MGGASGGTASTVVGLSLLPEYPSGCRTETQHVRAMVVALATAAKRARWARESALTFNDADTTDLFSQMSSALSKLLWKLEAHLVTQN
jgi:starvation-inducible DNA-binding protein